jgi:serine/threonine protein kinase
MSKDSKNAAAALAAPKIAICFAEPYRKEARPAAAARTPMSLQIIACLINSYAPVKGAPITIEADQEEPIQVVFERVAKVLGRNLVETNNTNHQQPSLAVQQLRQPRLYLNGSKLDPLLQFQDQNLLNNNTYTLLCDCRPRFPLLTPCVLNQVGMDQATNRPIVQLTTVPGQQAPYKYQFVRTLATAIYGKVKSCVKLTLQQNGSYAPSDPQHPEMFACKLMHKDRMTFYNANATIFSEDPMMEMATQQYLGTCMNNQPHPNVCGLVECCEDQHFIFSIMPFSNGGELYDYTIQARSKTHNGKLVECLPEDHARGIYRQVVHGLRHMHACFVVHSDLTLENVMVENGQPVGAKIIDFGMAKHTLPRTDGNGCYLLDTLRGGKRFYLAPEIWQPRPFVYDGYLGTVLVESFRYCF